MTRGTPATKFSREERLNRRLAQQSGEQEATSAPSMPVHRAEGRTTFESKDVGELGIEWTESLG